MEEEKGCGFCLVTVNFECVEKKTIEPQTVPGVRSWGGGGETDSSVNMRGTQRRELEMSEGPQGKQ